VAIEVPDGFGIVFRAIELDHHTFIEDGFAIKNSTFLKLSQMITKINSKDQLSLTVWRQNRDTKEGLKPPHSVYDSATLAN